MFVVGDVIARSARQEGREVVFPIAMHYSGNSAHKMASIFKTWIAGDTTSTVEDQRIIDLYVRIYKTPETTCRQFIDPQAILDYYSEEILWELKSLGISCDYGHYYTTKHPDFTAFVKTVISFYKEAGLLIVNSEGDVALNYDDKIWKEEMLALLERTEFLQPFQKKNVRSAVSDVRNDWPLLRNNGFGVVYDQDWIVDPMFDSEVFTIFDLYARFKNEVGIQKLNPEDFFRQLFRVLKGREQSNGPLMSVIINFLPCTIFIAEEHLKNWIVKKMYAESCLLSEKYQTKKYFVLGMGFLDGQQMSASRGHAILAKDLINEYGSTKSRLIILLGGGHPSKMYEYDHNLPKLAEKLLRFFAWHYLELVSRFGNRGLLKSLSLCEEITVFERSIKKNIDSGYYRQAVIELLSILPRYYRNNQTEKIAHQLLSVYNTYLDILLPNYRASFDHT